jgi:GrpB-like predicted nucleotidyltransferase (UPF0157 family)
MTIVVVEYDPEWPAEFERERAAVAAVLGDRAIAIEHIGSTAVPGLAAKPLIDLMAGLADFEQAPACLELLEAAGHERALEGDFPGRRFLIRPARHLSLTPHEGDYWRDQLAFRNALRADPELARAYGELKAQLAEIHDDPEDYTRAKTDFVVAALRAVGHRPRSGWAAEDG